MTTRPSAAFTSAPTVAFIVPPDLVVRELTLSLAAAAKVVPAASDGAGLGAGGLGLGAGAGAGLGAWAGGGVGVAAGAVAVSFRAAVVSCWASWRSRLRLSAVAAPLSPPPPPQAARPRTQREVRRVRIGSLLSGQLAGHLGARRHFRT